MINGLLNDPNYTAEQKVQLMQLMTEFTDLHRKLEQNKANEKWLMQNTIDKEYRIFETSLVDKVVNFKKVKLIESYEVEL